MRLTPSAFAFLVAGIASAQTYVVDAANGPGTNFTSIAAAVAAVPDGAVLLVRAGAYDRFVIDHKALSVLADPGVSFQPVFTAPTIRIQNTAATQTVVLRNFVMDSADGSIACTSCAGPVLLDQIHSPSPWWAPARLELTQCAQVVVTSSTLSGGGFWPAVMAHGSHFVLVDSSAVMAIAAGIEAHASRVQLVSSTVASAGYLNSVALLADAGCDVRLLGNSTISGSTSGIAIGGYPTVRHAPTVTFVGQMQTSSLAAIEDERLSGSGGGLGGSVSATLNGANSNLGALFLGVTAPPLFVPGIADSWWLDPAVSASVAVAFLSGPLTATVPIPPTPALRGQVFGFQGLFLAPTGLSVSNPYRFVIR